jgi:hypothetical protein
MTGGLNAGGTRSDNDSAFIVLFHPTAGTLRVSRPTTQRKSSSVLCVVVRAEDIKAKYFVEFALEDALFL